MSEPSAYGLGRPGPYDGGPPVCARHPDRVSYVRCQRCGRPTCTECQRPAAVGVQCVDCVAQQARAVRAPRTSFGGAVTRGRPVVTMTLIALCGLAWVGEQASPSVAQWFIFSPSLGWSEPWRAVTAGFLHATGTPLHLGLNMLSLWFLGSYLEPLLGRLRFLVLYLVGIIGGSAGVMLLAAAPHSGSSCVGYTEWCGGTVGASGAIFALFGALLLVNRGMGRSNSGMWPVLLINGVYSFLAAGVSWQGHVGGFLAGLLCGVLLWRLRGPARRWHVPAMLLVALVIVAACVVRYASVPGVLK